MMGSGLYMVYMMKTRCCYPGCEELRTAIDSGYKVHFGFMLWACDKHAQMYRDFDRRDRDHAQAFRKARLEAEEKFDEQYLKESPYPTIDFQGSVVD